MGCEVLKAAEERAFLKSLSCDDSAPLARLQQSQFSLRVGRKVWLCSLFMYFAEIFAHKFILLLSIRDNLI